MGNLEAKTCKDSTDKISKTDEKWKVLNQEFEAVRVKYVKLTKEAMDVLRNSPLNYQASARLSSSRGGSSE